MGINIESTELQLQASLYSDSNRQECSFSIGGLGFWVTKPVPNEPEDRSKFLAVLRPIPFSALKCMSTESHTKQIILRVWQRLISNRKTSRNKTRGRLYEFHNKHHYAQLSGYIFQTDAELKLILSSSFVLVTIDHEALADFQKLLLHLQESYNVRSHSFKSDGKHTTVSTSFASSQFGTCVYRLEINWFGQQKDVPMMINKEPQMKIMSQENSQFMLSTRFAACMYPST